MAPFDLDQNFYGTKRYYFDTNANELIIGYIDIHSSPGRRLARVQEIGTRKCPILYPGSAMLPWRLYVYNTRI